MSPATLIAKTSVAGSAGTNAPTSVAVTGLVPKRPYVLALSSQPTGGGPLQPLSTFETNAAGSAIVNAIGPIRKFVQGAADAERRYLVIVPGTPEQCGGPLQIQAR